MLLIGEGDRRVRMVPGAFRSVADPEVMVGRHWPPAGERVAVFMAYFEKRYRFAALGMGQRVMAMAAAHHRLNYIHPFLDGNGRVSRLMSHAVALEAGIGAHGLWSVSRGLARGDADRVTGLKERTARDLLASLVSDGILGSDTPKGPVSLRFPLDAVEMLFPGLFPEI
ncbi:MAG: Fic family protein [Aliidongia sp.]